MRKASGAHQIGSNGIIGMQDSFVEIMLNVIEFLA
jgi:hypothetical protein